MPCFALCVDWPVTQLELKANNAVQKYRCPQAQCGKQYTSMDVWQMVPRDNVGTGRKELCCAICGTDVVMVLDEGGKQLGTMEDKKERKKVGVVCGCVQ